MLHYNYQIRGSIKTTLSSWEGGSTEADSSEVLTIQPSARRLPRTKEDIATTGTKTTVKLFVSSTEFAQVEDAIKTSKYPGNLPVHTRSVSLP